MPFDPLFTPQYLHTRSDMVGWRLGGVGRWQLEIRLKLTQSLIGHVMVLLPSALNAMRRTGVQASQRGVSLRTTAA
jgi:hypothetical protein